MDLTSSMNSVRPTAVGTVRPPQPAQHQATKSIAASEPQFGASFGWSQEYRTSKFLRAARKNNIPKAQAQLASGVDVNARDRYQMTGLMHAAKYLHAPMVDFLLKQGAQPDLISGGGRTALQYTVWGHPDTKGQEPATSMVEKLAGLTDVNHRDSSKSTALVMASKNGFAEAVDVLLHHGADATIPDREGITSLMYAAWNGNGAMVEQLALSVPPDERRAFVNARNKYNRSAIDMAHGLGRKDIVSLLFRLGARPKQTEELDNTPSTAELANQEPSNPPDEA